MTEQVSALSEVPEADMNAFLMGKLPKEKAEPEAKEAEVKEVEAVEEPSDSKDDEDSPWNDPEKAKKYIEKLRKEAAASRVKFKEAEPKIKEYEKLREASQTDMEKLQERAAKLEKENESLRLSSARNAAARAHKLPKELEQFLGSGTEEEIDERAELLARFASQNNKGSKPVESLKAGGAPSVKEVSPNDFLLNALYGRN